MTEQEKRERRMKKILERAAKMQAENTEGTKEETDKLVEQKKEEVKKGVPENEVPPQPQQPQQPQQDVFNMYRVSKKSQQFEKKLLLASKIAGAVIGLLVCQKTSGWMTFIVLMMVTLILSCLLWTNSKPQHPAQIPLLEQFRHLQIIGYIEYVLSMSTYFRFYLNSVGFFSLALIMKIQLGLL